jgi:hypothetical protein
MTVMRGAAGTRRGHDAHDAREMDMAFPGPAT